MSRRGDSWLAGGTTRQSPPLRPINRRSQVGHRYSVNVVSPTYKDLIDCRVSAYQNVIVMLCKSGREVQACWEKMPLDCMERRSAGANMSEVMFRKSFKLRFSVCLDSDLITGSIDPERKF